MNWLLKIVEGPMKGAEIALMDGMRVKVGSADACDIVVNDATVAPEAFALDVSTAGVTLVLPDGSPRALKPFEVQTFGTTEIAVGPAEGAWGALTRPAPEPEAAPEAPVAETPAEAPAEAPVEAAPEASAPAEEKPAEKKGLAWLVWLLLGVLLFLVIIYLLLRFLPLACTERVRVACGGEPCARAEVPKAPTLAEMAAQHGLKVTEKNGVPCLTGNLKRRTERLALRALALACEPRCAFDLTDDESLKAAANELLFVVTEGALKATAASNRVVTMTGYAPNAAKLEAALRALSADVPGIARVLTGEVTVGGPTPKNLQKSAFAADGSRKGSGLPVPAGTTAAQLAKKPVYPIAGILVAPYPCVVMTNGLRCFEGGQIGNATVVKIEADKILLRDGKRVFEWKP